MHETSSFEFSRPFNPDKEATLLNSNMRKFVFSNSCQTHKTVQMNCIKTGLMFAKAWRNAPKGTSTELGKSNTQFFLTARQLFWASN